MRTITRAIAFSAIMFGIVVGTSSVAWAGGDEMRCDGPHCVDLSNTTTTTTVPPTTQSPVTTQPTLPPTSTLPTPTLPTPTLPTPTLPTPTLPPITNGGSNDLTIPTMPSLVPPSVPVPELIVPAVPDARDLATNPTGGNTVTSVSTQRPVPVTTETLPSAEPAPSAGANRVATSWNWPLIIAIGLVLGTLWGWYDRNRNRFLVAAATEDDDTVA